MFPETDLVILESLKHSNSREGAWQVFQRSYEPSILRWCRGKGLQQADAEDVTQEILISLYRRLPEHAHDPDRARFRAYLGAAVANAVKNYLRSRARRPFREGGGGDQTLARLADLEAPGLLETVNLPFLDQLDAELQQVVDEVRRKVGEQNWQAFFLTVEEKRSMTEVAVQVGMPLAEVYRARFRVRALLREALGQRREATPA